MGTNSREKVFYILNRFFQDGVYLEQSLKDIKGVDKGFIEYFCFGVLKNYKALSEYVMSLNLSKTRFKRIEKLIAAIGAYQILFMDSVPTYAAVNETIFLAKKHTHPSFYKKLNAILRKISSKGYEAFLLKADLKTRYSLSEDLEHLLSNAFSKEKLRSLLEVFQKEKVSFFRLRKNFSSESLQPFNDMIKPYNEAFYEVVDSQVIQKLCKEQSLYFQNPTPYLLVEFLKDKAPEKILDLCAAPGGKLLLAGEEFPRAKLFANDLSEQRLETIKENFSKYQLDAEFSCVDALEYDKKGFDLVILDVPCSNTGVIRKKPEAKFRFTREALSELTTLQKRLIEKALSLLNPGGAIWYMTCSILPEENEALIEEVCSKLPVCCKKSQTILPAEDGLDGGFAALLTT